MTAMAAIDYALTQKKLKVWHSNGQVSVFQDGSDVDADASVGRQYDDFWHDGMRVSATDPESAKIGIRLGRLEFGVNSPASFDFEIHDRIVTSILDIDLNDIVELWAEVGETLTPSIADFPDWHLNEQAPGQVRLFRGKVLSKAPTQAAPSSEAFSIHCEDPRAWADDVTIVTNIDQDILLPHLIINCETDEKGWLPAIKKSNDPAWPTHPTFQGGVPTTDGGKLTIRDALAYLSDYYADELTAAGVKVVGVDIFHDDDIEPLTRTLPKLDFVQTGFYEATRRILEFAPDYALTVDPKTTQWRIFPSRQLIVPGEKALTTAWVDGGATVDIDVSNASLFSATPGATGNWILLIDGDDSRQSIYAQVLAKVSATITIQNPGRAYATGSKVHPMESFDVQLPVINLDLKSGCVKMDLDEDLNGVYSAVRLTAFHQTVSERTVMRSTAIANLVPAWDDGFEDTWNLDKADREEDRGYDGLGIPIYQHTVALGVSKIEFYASLSQYGENHDFVGAVAEWLGCAVKFTFQAGVDASRERWASRITLMALVADLDGAGNKGYRITLAHDLSAHANGPGTIYTTLSPGGSGEIDRIKLTHDFSVQDLDGNRAANKLNANFEVNKKWAMTDTLMEEIQSQLPGCGVSAQVSGLAGINQTPISAYNPTQGGAPMTLQEVNDFWSKRVGTGNFAARGWFLKKPVADLGHSNCNAVNPPPPPQIEIKYTTTTTEVREARVPASGFGGMANALYGLERELSIQADRFTQDSQQSIYEDIAEAVFRDVSEPNHRGSVELLGIKPWLNLADLVCRVQLKNDDWTYHTAGWAYIHKYRAALSRVGFDFASQTTSLSFDREALAARLDGRTLEDLYVKEPEKAKAQKEATMDLQHIVACVQKPQEAPISTIPACRVIYDSPGGGGGRGGGKPSGLEPKEESGGTNETSIGIGTSNGGRGADWMNKGALASGIAERDHFGQVFFWSGMSSQAVSESGSTGNLLVGSTKRYTSLPQVNQQRIKALTAALLGANVATRDTQIHAKIGAGSTTTVIEIAVVGLVASEFAGGTCEIIGEEDKVRPIYTIASNDTDSVTLASAMSETPPAAGAVAVLRAPGLYALDATDFPDGGVAIVDADGEHFVIAPDGTMENADLVSGTLEAAGSPVDPILDLGQPDMLIRVKGGLSLGGERVTANGVFTGAIAADVFEAVFAGSDSARLYVPVNWVCEILRIEGRVKAGATVGDYFPEFGFATWPGGTPTFTDVAAPTGQEDDVITAFDEWDGLTPLATVGEDLEWAPAIRNDSSSDGALADEAHSISIVYRYRPS